MDSPPGSNSGLPALIRELRRRHVDRMVALYAGTSFGLAYAVDLLVDALGVPSVVLRVVVLIVLIGFPLMLIVGWIYDRTPDGWVRTADDPESFVWTPSVRLLVGAVLVASPLAIGWVGLRPVSPRTGDLSIPVLDDRVAIIPFDNQTGSEDFESLGPMVADWLIEGLSRMRWLRVIDAQTVLAGWALEAGQTAHELNASLVVTGRVQLRGDSIHLVARVVNRDGTLLAALPTVSAPAADPIRALDPLRGRVQAALGSVLDPAVADFEIAPAQPPLFQAYEAYIEGLEQYLNGSFIAAGESFARAVAMEESFDRAWVWLAQTDAAMRFRARFDSTTTLLSERRGRLAAYDQNRLDFATALIDRDYDAMYFAARGMLLAAPGSDDARREAALSAMRTRRHADAAQLLLGLDPDRGLIRSWDDYWVELTWVLLRSGDEARALAAAERGLAARGPNALQPLAALALVHAYHGRPPETIETVRRIFRAGDSETLSGIKLVISVSSLLSSAGYAAEASAMLEELRARVERARGGGEPAVVARRLELLVRMGRLDEAAQLRDSVAVTRPVDDLHVLGALAAAAGDTALALEWAQRLPSPGGFGAMIAAFLGDGPGVALHISQTPDDPHTGIVGDRDPLFMRYWRDPEFIEATATRS